MRIFVFGLALVAVLAACGGHDRSTAPDGGAADAAGDGTQGGSCGGLAGRRCSAVEYCDYPDGSCGAADQTGTCKRRPEVCPAVAGPPICGCDGAVYSSECAAYLNGTDLNASGGCPVPSGSFACGYAQCELATQYCRREPHAMNGDSASCPLLPASCGTDASCACLGEERCGLDCSGEPKGGLTVTCPPTP